MPIANLKVIAPGKCHQAHVPLTDVHVNYAAATLAATRLDEEHVVQRTKRAQQVVVDGSERGGAVRTSISTREVEYSALKQHPHQLPHL